MDVLLINTPIIRTNLDPDAGNSVPPIGMGYIYTRLTRSGYKCQFVDAVANGLLPDDVLKIINESDGEYIGLNVFSSNSDIVRNLVENAGSPKKYFLGGPASRQLISEVENWNPNGNITVIAGEAELVLPEIIRHPTLAEKHSSNLNIVNITPESRFYPSNIDLPLDRQISYSLNQQE